MANVPDCKSCNGGSSPPLTLAYLSHYAYAPGSLKLRSSTLEEHSNLRSLEHSDLEDLGGLTPAGVYKQ